ncbi:MAG TPA: hypothetical protein VFE05_13615 [Longimicrobiaceae bacterium]|jgi:hypothetical protein|nr:hypothetical protein [Longimicrobiaceae bacterium]
MFNWLRRRRLSAEARRKLLIVAARAEEAIIETHVDNIHELLHELDGEVDVDRAIELYLELMPLDETMAPTVTNRVLTRTQEPAAAPLSPRRPTAAEVRRFENVFRDDPRTPRKK